MNAMSAETRRPQGADVLGSCELSTWVLGTKLGSSAEKKKTCTLNCGAPSPGSQLPNFSFEDFNTQESIREAFLYTNQRQQVPSLLNSFLHQVYMLSIVYMV